MESLNQTLFLWLNAPERPGALALLGFPIAWARIYLGVHFPFDMLEAGTVAVFST